MSDKTIWILNHHAITPDIGGGTRHYDFGKELVKRGYRVYIFASSFIHNKYINLLDKGEISKELLIDGIHWVWINTKAYRGNGKDRILGMIGYYRFMMNHYKEYPKPDIIIGSAVHLLACAAGYKISKKVNAKCISEIRDLWPETLIELGSLRRNSITAQLMYKLEKYIYKNSKEIIVTAPGMADYISNRGISGTKITYINNGADIESYDLRKEMYSIESTPIQFENLFNVVYLGAFGKANAIETIINAGKIISDKGISDISFTLIGDGPLKEQLKRQAAAMDLSNFIFYDTVAKLYVPDILSHADCLIFSAVNSPLYRYGISANKLFDYMCSGKPIIYSINSLNDFAKESGGGISVEPENPRQMADAIISLYRTSKEERMAIGNNGRKYIEENFDIPILVDKLEEVMNT